MTLVDTDILIDLQRGFPPAVEWVQTVPAESFAIPGLAALELVAGSRTKEELEKANWYLAAMEVLAIDEADFNLALHFARQHSIRGGLSLADYFIGSQAVNRDATLLTFNLRHFRAEDRAAVCQIGSASQYPLGKATEEPVISSTEYRLKIH